MSILEAKSSAAGILPSLAKQMGKVVQEMSTGQKAGTKLDPALLRARGRDSDPWKLDKLTTDTWLPRTFTLPCEVGHVEEYIQDLSSGLSFQESFEN